MEITDRAHIGRIFADAEQISGASVQLINTDMLRAIVLHFATSGNTLALHLGGGAAVPWGSFHGSLVSCIFWHRGVSYTFIAKIVGYDAQKGELMLMMPDKVERHRVTFESSEDLLAGSNGEHEMLEADEADDHTSGAVIDFPKQKVEAPLPRRRFHAVVIAIIVVMVLGVLTIIGAIILTYNG